MRAWLIAIAIWTMLASGYAVAQQSGPNVANFGQYGPPFATQGGHFILGGGPAPSLNSSCGTGAIAPVGTDSAFQFTTGSSATSACLITFAAPWNSVPTCQLNDSTGGAVPTYFSGKASIVLSGAASSHAYNVQCVGQPGG